MLFCQKQDEGPMLCSAFCTQEVFRLVVCIGVSLTQVDLFSFAIIGRSDVETGPLFSCYVKESQLHHLLKLIKYFEWSI